MVPLSRPRADSAFEKPIQILPSKPEAAPAAWLIDHAMRPGWRRPQPGHAAGTPFAALVCMQDRGGAQSYRMVRSVGMTEYTKVSVSLPAHLLLLAKHSHLQAPDESLSAFLARLLDDALRRRDEQADLDFPPTPDEEQVSDAFARAGLTSAFDAPAAPGPSGPERHPKRTRRRAAG